MIEYCSCGSKTKAATTRGYSGVECTGCGRREINPAETFEDRMELKQLNQQEVGMERYEWRVVSQWDTPAPEYYIEVMEVKTYLSTEICRFMLCHVTDMGGGRLNYHPVNTDDVTMDMVKLAELQRKGEPTC